MVPNEHKGGPGYRIRNRIKGNTSWPKTTALLGLSQPAQTGDVSLSCAEDASTRSPRPCSSVSGEPVLVIELKLSSERKLAREDVNKVMTHLRTQGYHLQMPPQLQTRALPREPD